MKKSLKTVLFVIVMQTIVGTAVRGKTIIPEKLDRGLVAIKTADGVFLSWRLLSAETPDARFNIYKNGDLLTAQSLAGGTCYVDPSGKEGDQYTVKTVAGKIEPVSKTVTPWEKPYKVIPTNRPESYLPNDCSVGDLDGDGEYEIIVKWHARSHDNSHNSPTDPVFLDAYKLDGTQLWRINLGPNIRAGAHYTQFMVYDLDGDGKAEIACKTAPGTVDGQNKPIVLGNDDPKADYRNPAGHIIDGPEYLTVFDGQTGAEITTIPYNPPRGNDLVTTWGDGEGNRSDRYLACIAYLDGKNPSLVMCRGYYTRAVLAAYDLKDGKLHERWVYDSGSKKDTKNTAYGQGNHSIAVADVDGDGCDEIIYGGAAIDHDGSLLYTTGLGHGDAHHLSDLDPDRPGLEFFDVHENKPSPAGVELRDAKTGELLFGRPTTIDVGRGLAADIDSRYRGFEFWTAASDSVYNIKGEVISTRKPSVNFRIYWDGDVQDELLDGTKITKWNGEKGETELLVDFQTYGASAINGTKNNPCLSADLFGDWREEVLYFDRKDPSRLMIFSSTTRTGYRFPSLMQDHVYRMAVATQNVAYNQPPHLGFYIGDDSIRQILPDKKEVLRTMTQVNDYFMEKYADYTQPSRTDIVRPSNIWTRGVYYEGLVDLYRIYPQEKYYNYMHDWAKFHRYGFRNGNTTRNADDQCCGQTYIDLYTMAPDPEKIRNIKACMNMLVYTPQIDDWSWIDAIQMGMPALAKLGELTGDRRYFEKMYQMYSFTRNNHGETGLYNPQEGLWWRDADFLPPYKEPNGKNCYWSRGNGWVYAALVRVLEYTPEDETHRKEYIADFRAMSEALKNCQREDGFWNVSLHDPDHFGGKETTGTSLFVYGMAWGINHGILDRKTYLPLVLKAWNGLVNDAVHPNGFLGYVQGTGKEPKDGQPVTSDKIPNFEDYGVGCFLLGAGEIYRLH